MTTVARRHRGQWRGGGFAALVHNQLGQGLLGHGEAHRDLTGSKSETVV